jgi:hypothetical protein
MFSGCNLSIKKIYPLFQITKNVRMPPKPKEPPSKAAPPASRDGSPATRSQAADKKTVVNANTPSKRTASADSRTTPSLMTPPIKRAAERSPKAEVVGSGQKVPGTEADEMPDGGSTKRPRNGDARGRSLSATVVPVVDIAAAGKQVKTFLCVQNIFGIILKSTGAFPSRYQVQILYLPRSCLIFKFVDIVSDSVDLQYG